MTRLAEAVAKIRSKNAGPFWLTIDIFCGSSEAFARVSRDLTTETVATAFQIGPQVIKRFDLDRLHVVKFSLPRPYVQGTVADRDMHGASYATLLRNIEI
ncbi:MAG: DUF4387 family protein [Pseudomonadota bacterium]